MTTLVFRKNIYLHSLLNGAWNENPYFYHVRFSFIDEEFFKANVQPNKSRTLKKAMDASR